MRYIIKESRLSNVIMNYLDDEFSGLKFRKEKILDTTYNYWKDGDETVFEITEINDDGNFDMGVSFRVWDAIKSTFNLDDTLVEHYLKIWVQNNFGLHPIDFYNF